MRKIAFLFLLILSLISLDIFSQTQENFNYQAVVRDADGELITDQSISVKLSIIESTIDGTVIYTETHSITSGSTGIINLLIGNGTSDLGDFTTIDWGLDAKFIKIEIDAGSGLADMGTFQLFSVPYALYAVDVENKNDADADPENEIQDLNLTDDDVLTITNHPSPTEINLAPFTGTNTDEQELTLVGDTLIISNGNEVILPYDSSNWVIQGNTMYYNGGNVGIGSSSPVSTLEVKANTAGTDALFQVINANNDTVFAVYPDGVKIFIDPTAKGKVGGFAVSGRIPSKAGNIDILRVTVDSTRIYVSDSVGVKGKVGGFAVSGRIPSKGVTNNYLHVTRDSTRIYITESTTKGKVGGFAVSGRIPSKGIERDYFNISANLSAQTIDPSEARIFWYPKKEAFLTGRVLVESPDSVGTNSMATGFESKSIGEYSQAFGYKARAFGENSTAIGNNANAVGNESYAIGNFAKTTNTGSYAIGSGASATGAFSFAIGSTGVDSAGNATSATMATADYAYAFGMGSIASAQGAFAFGTQDTASGEFSTAIGHRTTANYLFSTAMGNATTASGRASTAMGDRTTASGPWSTAMGYTTTASSWYSTAMGFETTASGEYSTAMGFATTASEKYSIAMGFATTASGDYSIAMGDGTTASNQCAIAMGSGTTASGERSTAMGHNTEASMRYSTAMGFETTASEEYATAMGNGTTASGASSIAMGNGTTASGPGSTAMGLNTTSGGIVSTAMGRETTASGSSSTAMGNQITARPYNSFVIGRYNDTTALSLTSWEDTDPLFIIGNGDSDPTRHNAVMVTKEGEVYLPDVYWDAVGAVNGDLLIDDTGKIGRLTSSLRYKKEINSMEDVSWLYQLHPVNFIYKNDNTETKQYGLIAEEVEEINPLFVSYNKEGEVEAVSYSKLVTPMLKALQEQEKQIDELKTENQDLRKENEEFKNRLSEIEKLLMVK